MDKGLSPLQIEILKVLEKWPSLEDQPVNDGKYNLRNWARLLDIIRELDRPNTASTRATISKALARLCERGDVYAGHGQIVGPGKGFHYVRITNPKRT
jgi:hypothetical protein